MPHTHVHGPKTHRHAGTKAQGCTCAPHTSTCVCTHSNAHVHHDCTEAHAHAASCPHVCTHVHLAPLDLCPFSSPSWEDVEEEEKKRANSQRRRGQNERVLLWVPGLQGLPSSSRGSPLPHPHLGDGSLSLLPARTLQAPRWPQQQRVLAAPGPD